MSERESIVAWYFDDDGTPVAMGRFGTIRRITGGTIPTPVPVPGDADPWQKITIPFDFDLAKGDQQPVAETSADIYYVDIEVEPNIYKTFIILKGTIRGTFAGGGDVAVGYRAWLPQWLNPTDMTKVWTGHSHLWIDGNAGWTGTAKFTNRGGSATHLIFQFQNSEWELLKPTSWAGKKMHCTFTLIYERDADV